MLFNRVDYRLLGLQAADKQTMDQKKTTPPHRSNTRGRAGATTFAANNILTLCRSVQWRASGMVQAGL